MVHVVKGCSTEKECKITTDSNLPFNQYISDGKTKDYLFKFLLLNPKFLSVYATAPDAQASPCDKLVLDTDYIIRAYGVDGGDIELSKIYPKGYIITLTLDSNYNVDTHFKEGRTFSGAELDLVFKQISLYFKELALLFNTTLKFPINSIVDPISTYVPSLKDDYIWVGKNNQVIQVPIPTGGGGGSDCCKILTAELANNMEGVDGARMIGLYDSINNIQTNVAIAINKILNTLNNITTVPKPKPDEVYLPLSNDKNGKVFWDKSVIGSVYTYLDKVFGDEAKGLLYLNGAGYYPFETSDEGIPYSRLADIWWNPDDDRYEFGGAGNAYYSAIFPNTRLSVFLLINDIRIKPNVVFENVDLVTFQEYKPSTMACSQIINGNRLEVYERDQSVGGFSDSGSGVKFEIQEYTPNDKGNSGVLDFNEAKIHYVGGEYFTFFGIRVYYIVNGKGRVPSSSGIRRMVKVDLPDDHTLGEVEFFTKHALIGTGIYAINPNFRENAVFSLTSPDLKVYLKSGTAPNEYTRESITLYIPDDVTGYDRARLIKQGINKYSFAVPDARDLHLRGSDADMLDTSIAWRNIEARKKFRLQYGGICISDIVKKHSHIYEHATGSPGGPVIINYDTASNHLYATQSPTTTFGGIENRVAAMEVYFYVKY